MTPKSVASPLALAAAAVLSFSPAAFAQATTVGTQEINAADLPTVTTHCEGLVGQSTVQATGLDPNSGNPDAEENAPEGVAPAGATDLSGSAEPTTAATSGNIDQEEVPPEGELAQAEASPAPVESDPASGNIDAADSQVEVNLDEITLADCQAAGLVN